MKLAVISLIVFMVAKPIYGYWGDYDCVAHTIAYYLPTYFMLFSFCRALALQAVGRLAKDVFRLGAVLFAVLFLLNAVCLIDTSWYDPLMATSRKITVGSSVVAIGLLVINYKRIISRDRQE